MRWLAAPALLGFAAAIAIVFWLTAGTGYGDNNDNYGMLRAWQEMVANGRYVPSRFQGDLPSELALGALASRFGPWGANSLSFAASLLSLAAAGLLLGREDSRRTGLAVATVALNPAWMNAASTGMDYLHPLPFFLFACWLARRGLFPLAAVLFGVAAAIRLQFAPLSALVLAWLWWREPQRRALILQSLVVYGAVAALWYLPVFIASHLSLSFLTSYRPTWQGVPGLLVRWLYKVTMLYGVPGSLVVAAAFARARSNRPAPNDGFVATLCGLIIAYHLALFLYIPIRVEYLLPALVGVAGLLVVWRAPLTLLLALCAVEFGGWFVQWAPLRFAYVGDPCLGVFAVAGEAAPRFELGPIAQRLADPGKELVCWPRLLRARPADIRDPLPAPQGSSSLSQ